MSKRCLETTQHFLSYELLQGLITFPVRDKNTGACRGIYGKMSLTAERYLKRNNQDIDIWCKVKW